VKKIDRVMQLSRLLSNRRQPLPLTSIQEQLGCSERTARRLLEDLRNRFKAPVEYDRTRRGWILGHASAEASELPGLWFTDAELYAFMVSQRLLADLQPGVFDEHLAPIRARLEALLAHAAPGRPDLARRVRILQMAARPVNVEHFRKITTALLDRKRLRVLYHGRERDETTERTVSPQRLVYYRSNWYLDAWCHLRNDLRSFSLDRLHPVLIAAEPAHEIGDAQLDHHFTSSYGIFAGTPKATAVLRFSPSAARWVADEHWHPQQQGKVLPSGTYELRVPYSDPRELARDILQHGPEVEVIAPKALRTHIAELAARTAAQYRKEKK
jgi:predicted DNA-binding transcriptional regulator YafY